MGICLVNITDMTLQAGITLGTYRIDSWLGRGENGEVYRAFDVELNRFVALKVMSTDLTAHGSQLARFRRDAGLGAVLSHPNIARVFDVGCQQGIPYVASELLHGSTLGARLRQGPLPVPTALDYARQMAGGLAAAHEAGVAHRDLKPENIFITRDDCVKILDFGLARCWFEALELLQADGRGNAGRAVLRDVAYLSPEQVRGEDADERSDIFSLGVMIYEMLSGATPFGGPTTIETLKTILAGQPRSLRAYRGEIGENLERVVRRCLAGAASERFPSMRDVEFSLEVAATAADPSPWARQAPSRRRAFDGVGVC